MNSPDAQVSAIVSGYQAEIDELREMGRRLWEYARPKGPFQPCESVQAFLDQARVMFFDDQDRTGLDRNNKD